ncbi:hypothetical protein Ddye_009500 [Dipteronia dyeriana]|uniref:Uncharacterized protein n=1 Tax=Dipteronia dyeriana TaxID=168575 RepID=A0AAD9XBP9_9ROSI|nr:hypothetical protein Ddye_009500 [Dipteronia dyeriana]
MGLPNGTEDVEYDMGQFDETCIRMKNLLLKKKVRTITLSSLMKKLNNMKEADDVFRISFILFTISTLLCLPESSKINEALLTQLKIRGLYCRIGLHCNIYMLKFLQPIHEQVYSTTDNTNWLK